MGLVLLPAVYKEQPQYPDTSSFQQKEQRTHRKQTQELKSQQ